MKIAALYCVYNEEDYIEYSLRSVYSEMDKIVICLNVGRPWYGEREKSDKTLEIIENFKDYERKITLVKGEWLSEPEQRNEALSRVNGEVSHCLIIDGDEVWERAHLKRLKEIAYSNPHIGQLAVRMNTYWKSPLYRIDPAEPYTPIVISRVTPYTSFTGLRQTNEFPIQLIPRELAILYHFSYAKSSETIKKKIENFSHAPEVVRNWFEEVWLKWDEDNQLENLHPTHPYCYKRAIYESPEHLPKVMRNHPFVKQKI